jgi:hypothetical protein
MSCKKKRSNSTHGDILHHEIGRKSHQNHGTHEIQCHPHELRKNLFFMLIVDSEDEDDASMRGLSDDHMLATKAK